MDYLKIYEDYKYLTSTYWSVGDDIVTLSDILDYLGIIEIDPIEVEHLLIDVERDLDRVELADYNYPILLIKKSGRFDKILDGQHRVIKAIRDGVKVRCIILDLDSGDVPDKFRRVLG